LTLDKPVVNIDSQLQCKDAFSSWSMWEPPAAISKWPFPRISNFPT